MKRRKPKIKPRNHLVKLALFRKAGKHGKSNKAKRRQDLAELKYEL